MPHSVLLECHPKQKMKYLSASPQALHGLFFNLLENAAPELSKQIHLQSRKTFTISPLRSIKSSTKGLYQLRFTTLDDQIFHSLSYHFLQRLSEPIQFRLGHSEIILTRLLSSTSNHNPWSNFHTYSQLLDDSSETNTRLSLRFYSPTLFKSGDNLLPLPVPEMVFDSYLQRWIRFSSLPLPVSEDTLKVAFSRYLAISKLNITTEKLGHTPGFIGTVVYLIRSTPPPEIIKSLNLLADYAYYCGTGYKTTMGFGWTRRLPNRDS